MQVCRLRTCVGGSAEGRIERQRTSRNLSSKATQGTGFPGGFQPQHAMIMSGGPQTAILFVQVKGDKDGAVQ